MDPAAVADVADVAVTGDCSFAMEYHGPPLPFELPLAFPLDLGAIPFASVAVAPNTETVRGDGDGDGEFIPVVQPIVSSPLVKPAPPTLCGLPLPSPPSPTSVMDTESGSSGLLVSAASVVSSNFDLSSRSIDENYPETLVDAVAGAGHDKSFLATFDSSEFSSSAPGFRFTTPVETGKKRSNCSRCKRGAFFASKESCLACDAKYCRDCVLQAMGSMPEGRKCLGCIGRPVIEAKRNQLGKSSHLLRSLLNDMEVVMVMHTERKCEANQLRAEDVFVNGKRLSSDELAMLLGCLCPPPRLRPGYYWYDKVSGYWGKEGHKPSSVITPNLKVGGILDQGASNGSTGILINGREITKSELRMLKLAGVQCAGRPHFWLNADGTYLEEGQKKERGNIWNKPIVKLLSPVLSLPTPKTNFIEFTEEFNKVVPHLFERKTFQKLLLVGFHGSGSSTIFKQAKFLYNRTPFSTDERQAIKLSIQSSIYKYLGVLLEGREMFEQQSLVEGSEIHQRKSLSTDACDQVNEYLISPRLKDFSDWLLEVISSGNLETIFLASAREYAPRVAELWNDAAIQATYKRRSELRSLPSVASYFLDRVVDVSRMDFDPTDEDILYAEGASASNGLICTDFTFPLDRCSRLSHDDVDQQDAAQRYLLMRANRKTLGENCKWLDMFEDVRLVAFCVPLCDYDVYCKDADGEVVNKMLQSRKFFEQLVTHPSFHKIRFLLILNKSDVLEQKINASPLTPCDWFADFDPVLSRNNDQPTSSCNLRMPSTQAQIASYYIACKFKQFYFTLTGLKLYVTFTNALDSKSVDTLLRYAKEILKWEEEKHVYMTAAEDNALLSTESSSY